MKKYIFVAFVAVLSVTCFASYSFGIDKAKKLLALGHCPECDLSGADLYGAYLSNAKLKGADLSRANLSKASLFGADLSEAILCKTKTPWGLDNSGCK